MWKNVIKLIFASIKMVATTEIDTLKHWPLDDVVVVLKA